MNATRPESTTTETIATEERGLAVMTHLSGLAGYLVPLGGILVPVVIWFAKSDSRTIAAIAKQAIVLNVVVWVVGLLLVIPAITLILLPLAIVGWTVLGITAIALPVIGAIKASGGAYYRYPLVGSAPAGGTVFNSGNA